MYVIVYQDPITGKQIHVQHENLQSAVEAIRSKKDELYFNGAATSEMIDPYKHPVAESRSEIKEEKKVESQPESDGTDDYDYDFYPFQGY